MIEAQTHVLRFDLPKHLDHGVRQQRRLYFHGWAMHFFVERLFFDLGAESRGRTTSQSNAMRYFVRLSQKKEKKRLVSPVSGV